MPPHRWTIPVGGLVVGLLTVAVLAATEPRLAIVWDEGYTLGREARLRLWFSALRDPAGFAAHWVPPAQELVQQKGAPPPLPGQVDSVRKLLFDPQVLAYFWPFAREEPHGHPPFYALAGLVGDVLRPGAPALERARTGPMLVYSLAAGIVFVFVAQRWAIWPAVLASGAWVLQPRMFAHAHYATYDALLVSLWVCAIATFAWAVGPPERLRVPRWGWAVAFGLIAGCAADTKLTGWLLPLPFLVWALLYRERKAFLTLVLGGLVALVLLYLLNPPWWTEPVTGVVRFFASNLNRAASIRIKTEFLGAIYETPNGSLPWYNTLVWTVFVTPVGFLAFALAGVVRAVRLRWSEPIGVLLVGHWAFLLLLRSLPHTPGHDAERQFLPAFGVLAVVAALGGATMLERSKRWGKVLIAAALAEGVLGIALMMPVPLSYYSPLVGGLPGAARLGMEPTYYWDALSDDALDWINRNTGPDENVLFATNPTSWMYLRQEGKLRPGFFPVGVVKWYVMQNRPGEFEDWNRTLVARVRPVYVAEKWGVPLVWIFRYDDVNNVLRQERAK